MDFTTRHLHVMDIYLYLLFAVVGFQYASAQLNEITFRMQEQQKYGYYVGNVAVASDIQRNISNELFATLTYKFLNPNSLQTASLFSINRRSGAIYTAAVIDRETVKRNEKEVCAFVALCVIEFDVTVQSINTSFLKIITVKIVIEDINDSPPTFTPSEIQISVSESVNAGNKIPIEGATDKDTAGRNSIQSYEITDFKDVFDVEFKGKLDGSSSLKLVVKRGLDRERRDRYQFKILAKDGGNPPRTGTLTVNIHVIDVNDNAPVFSLQRYTFDVKETTLINSAIGRVSARDNDSGKNARVLYRFSTLTSSKLEELFTLDQTSGELIVKKPLQYESGNTFETVIEAVDKGETPQASQATLVISVLDVGNTPPKITLTLASPVYEDTIMLSEGSGVQTTFLGRAKVEDNDSGRNGEVHCSSLDVHFSVQEIGANSFAIRLHEELDRERRDKHNVTILCQDSGSPSMSSTAWFIVQVTDVNDNSPVFTKNTYQANVTENNNRTIKLVTVKAIDDDLGVNGELSYSLSMDAGSMFSIDPERGVISSHGAFDRETLSKMTFLVKAVDHGKIPRTGTATVNVNILDINDNRPYFPPTPRRFYIPENQPSGRSVGQLTARDRDVGVNAALQFKTLTNDPSIPFVVFSDGVIRTDRELDREVKDKYILHVSVTDNGQPPMYSNGTVTIIVQDMNDHSPTIVFPNDENNTIVVYSDVEPGTTIAAVIAQDDDIDKNAMLTYVITGGNRGNVFAIGRTTGEVHLTRRLTLNDNPKHRLTISVQDGGAPQRESPTLLNIDIVFTNTTIFDSMNADRDAHKYIVIAGIVAGVTVILSIIIVSIILFIRRNDNLRREAEEKTGVQEECGKRELDRRIWQEVSTEDVKAGFEKPEKGDKLYKPKMDKDSSFTIDPDRNAGDSFLSHAALDQYGKPEFFTFRKSHGPFSEDVRSDASGETTTSDSGRGGSEEDIQLPPLPDLKGFNGSHQIFSVAIDENEEFSPQNTPRELREKSRTLSTFSNSNMANKIALPTTSSFRDIHTYNDPNFRNNQRNQHKVRFNTDSRTNGQRFPGHGKQMKIPKDFNGRINVPVISHGDLPLKHTDQAAFSYLGSYNSLPRSVDDDDNTTTSGSYTLNPDDFEEVFCER